jgi:TatD DNase family protein
MIDSHAHLGDSAFEEEIEALLQRARAQGVRAIINICTDEKTLKKGMALQKNYPWIFSTAATTPHDVAKEGEHFFSIVEQHARSQKLVAIGETGLDYYYEHSPRDLQNHFLQRYLELASACRLPVVIHCREAFEDLFRSFDRFSSLKGVLHCFTGTLEEAKAGVDRGLFISLSGIVTFKKSDQLREVARQIPLNHLLIETDAPYLAPLPHRGKRNESAFVQEVAATIAQVRGVALEAIIEATFNNSCALFQLDKTALKT